jgi:hypothetical protein
MKKTRKVTFTCSICGVVQELAPSIAKKRKFCSAKCKGKSQEGVKWSDEQRAKLSESLSGENNPNYGNKWSDEQKEHSSQVMREKVDDEFREHMGSYNRGVKFSQERIDAMHGDRTPESYSRPKSDETKAKIGKSSKERHTHEGYTDNITTKRTQTRIANGTMVSPEDIPDYDLYWKEANWLKVNMWDIAMSGQELLKEHGVFQPKINNSGVVRDHILSRTKGFYNGVFPEILRHPCNCQILTISENSSRRYLEENVEEVIEELFDRIEKYDIVWEEQDLVLTLITQYREGNRWTRI